MSVVSLGELYQDPEARTRFEGYNWRVKLPLDSMLARAEAEALTEQTDMVAYLDDLRDQDFNAWFDIKQVITYLPPKTIFDNYGEEVLVWAAANSTFEEIRKQLYEGLEDLADYDQDLLEKSRLWCWLYMHGSTKGKDMTSQYSVMDLIVHGGLDKIDLNSHLKAAAAPGVELSDKRLADYSLVPLRAEKSYTGGVEENWYGEVEPGVSIHIWVDAPTGFALNYKGRPNALVAVGVSQPGELMIYQLQGVQARRVDPEKINTSQYFTGKISSRGLAPLDWQKLMVDITSDIAKNMNLTSVGIQAGKHNKWSRIHGRDEIKPHLSRSAAAKAYDKPAQRLGFTRGTDGNWHKAVKQDLDSVS